MSSSCRILLLVVFSFGISAAAQQVSRRNAVVAVVEKAGPAIVNISTERLTRSAPAPHFDDFFEEFFRRHRSRVRKTHSLGSGVIVDSSGFIVTNEHVVRRGSKIKVGLRNGRVYEADLVASDIPNDLALLKIRGKQAFQAIHWGTSSDIMIGEDAIALGNPFGLHNTVTTGVISATERAVAAEGKPQFNDFIQTDAAINPGNSGGALLNVHGRLIGINTAIYAKGQGLGFAIPVDRVRMVIGRLLNYKKLKGAWLGMQFKELRQGIRWHLQVSKVFDNSPAQRVGIEVGDVIEGASDENVHCLFDFCRVVYLKSIGSPIQIRLNRKGKKREVRLRIAPVPIGSKYLAVWKKIGFLPVEKYGGIVVGSVRRGSSAERIGLRNGDIVVALAGYRVRNVKELSVVLRNSSSGEILNIILLRNGRRLGGNVMVE